MQQPKPFCDDSSRAVHHQLRSRPGPIVPSAVRYIKLGPGNRWAQQSFAEDKVPFGYRDVTHAACAAGDWEAVRRELAAAGRAKSAGQAIRELREFYTLGQDVLWVTLADGHLWWTFACTEVYTADGAALETPARFRQSIHGWQKQSVTGQALATSALSSAFTRTASFQGTICSVERADYIIRKINGDLDPLRIEAEDLQKRNLAMIERLLANLHWQDFENLIDLIFQRSSWRRVSVLGENQRDVDLLLQDPLTGERAWVQIKSRARQADLDDYLQRFYRDGSYDRFFFACHSPIGALRLPDKPRLHLWSGESLARLIGRAGLFEWLLEKAG